MYKSILTNKYFLLTGCLVVLLGMGVFSQLSVLAAQAPFSEEPLRTSEPISEIVADLQEFIPFQMELAGIPGLSIALIRDGQVVWAQGFGVANILTGEPVTADTVFEAASNSKVVTAYTALRLVEQGLLSLDEPVNTYLAEPWLPPSAYAEQITLRQLASHNSGLTDNLIPLDKSILFRPGSDFLYSGVGYLYLQAVIEQVTRQPLDEVANARVFEPLEMTSSSFVNSPETRPHLANGHIDTILPVLAFAVPFGLIFTFFGLISLIILRIRSGTWRSTRKMVATNSLVSGLLTILVYVLLIGGDLPNLVLMIAIAGVIFIVALALMDWSGRTLFNRLSGAFQGRKTQALLRIIWFGLSLFVLLKMTRMITGPMPTALSSQPSAVGSLRTTAPDLAKFLIEVADPQYLSTELAAQMRTAQVSAGRNMSWGLGPGIQQSENGNALWQNGNTFGFRSLMVIYPEQQSGVVVFTNSDQGFPLACQVAQRALGGSAIPAIVTWLE